MRCVLELSKEDIALSKAEAMSLVRDKRGNIEDKYLRISVSLRELELLSVRLAFTRRIFKVLFECKESDLIAKVKRFDWNKVYDTNFSVDSFKDERGIAKIIYERIKEPKVNLRNANTQIKFLKLKGRVYSLLLMWENVEDFASRKPNKRPELHPSSLDPRFARALINLTGIKKGSLVDLFCGSGGVLIEAGVMGLYPVGYDIDPIMLNRCRINLTFYGVNSFTLYESNALSVGKKIKYIVSDLPYGKNTKGGDFSRLYSDFLGHLGKILVGRAVIVLPEFRGKKADYSQLIRKSGLKIVYEFTKYIHGTLTRKIYVIEKKK